MQASSAWKPWLESENSRIGISPRPNNKWSTFSEFPESFQPGFENNVVKKFRVPHFLIPKSELLIFTSVFANPKIVQKFKDGENILFPVHPAILNRNIPKMAQIRAHTYFDVYCSPTSSTRTLFVQDSIPYCIKLHTDLRITRWRRHMELRKVQHAIAVTNILCSYIQNSKTPCLSIFPEIFGAVYSGSNSADRIKPENWGFIVRDMNIFPSSLPMNSKNELVSKENPRKSTGQFLYFPLNALYLGTDPLLPKLIKCSNLDPDQYIFSMIFVPLISEWFDTLLKTGVLLEPHGQNVVVQLFSPFSTNSFNLKLEMFIHRDFDCEVDPKICHQNGFSQYIKNLNSKDFFTLPLGNPSLSQPFPSSSTTETKIISYSLTLIFDTSIRTMMDGIAKFATNRNKLMKDFVSFLKNSYPTIFLGFPSHSFNYLFDSGKLSVIPNDNISPWRKIQK